MQNYNSRILWIGYENYKGGSILNVVDLRHNRVFNKKQA